jgi:chromosome segregation ATPase
MSWDTMSEKQRGNRLSEHLENIRTKSQPLWRSQFDGNSGIRRSPKAFRLLKRQKNDLEKSIKILEERESKNRRMRPGARFFETFDAVDKKFREIFPILFNGGKAQLMLSNPDNLLESGVDILVQPPGQTSAKHQPHRQAEKKR